MVSGNKIIIAATILGACIVAEPFVAPFGPDVYRWWHQPAPLTATEQGQLEAERQAEAAEFAKAAAKRQAEDAKRQAEADRLAVMSPEEQFADLQAQKAKWQAAAKERNRVRATCPDGILISREEATAQAKAAGHSNDEITKYLAAHPAPDYWCAHPATKATPSVNNSGLK